MCFSTLQKKHGVHLMWCDWMLSFHEEVCHIIVFKTVPLNLTVSSFLWECCSENWAQWSNSENRIWTNWMSSNICDCANVHELLQNRATLLWSFCKVSNPSFGNKYKTEKAQKYVPKTVKTGRHWHTHKHTGYSHEANREGATQRQREEEEVTAKMQWSGQLDSDVNTEVCKLSAHMVTGCRNYPGPLILSIQSHCLFSQAKRFP